MDFTDRPPPVKPAIASIDPSLLSEFEDFLSLLKSAKTSTDHLPPWMKPTTTSTDLHPLFKPATASIDRPPSMKPAITSTDLPHSTLHFTALHPSMYPAMNSTDPTNFTGVMAGAKRYNSTNVTGSYSLINHIKSLGAEFVVHRGKGLNDVTHIGTMNPYAFISITGNGTDPERRRTITHNKGGSDPVWDFVMKFNVDASMLDNCALVCDIKHRGMLSDKKIGQVIVPFQRLLDGDATRVSYPVMTPSRKLKGEIVISHTLKVVANDLTTTIHVEGEASGPPPAEVQQTRVNCAGRLGQWALNAIACSAHFCSIADNAPDVLDS